jgi:hypothetical protein
LCSFSHPSRHQSRQHPDLTRLLPTLQIAQESRLCDDISDVRRALLESAGEPRRDNTAENGWPQSDQRDRGPDGHLWPSALIKQELDDGVTEPPRHFPRSCSSSLGSAAFADPLADNETVAQVSVLIQDMVTAQSLTEGLLQLTELCGEHSEKQQHVVRAPLSQCPRAFKRSDSTAGSFVCVCRCGRSSAC